MSEASDKVATALARCEIVAAPGSGVILIDAHEVARIVIAALREGALDRALSAYDTVPSAKTQHRVERVIDAILGTEPKQ